MEELSTKQQAIIQYLMEDEHKTKEEIISAYETEIGDFNTEDDSLALGSLEISVFTDSEMEQAWDDSLDSYIDDCLDIPEHVINYFDEERWKSDARIDGAGTSLAYYDGMENEYNIDGETIYIYRTN